MPKSKPFIFGYGVIVVLLIIYLGSKVSFIFQPIVVLVQTLFFPFLLSGILYYLFRPIVELLESWGVPRVLSILLIYVAFISLFVMLGFLLGPILSDQFKNLVDNFPAIMNKVQKRLIELQKHPWISPYIQWNDISSQAVNYLKNSITDIGRNIAQFIGIIMNIIVVFVTVPFILYYMLKEGEKAPKYFLRILPAQEREHGMKILRDMDLALSSYIKGQVLVSLFVGLVVYIGYLIIDLDYALILALGAVFTNVIPFVGPLIGTIPALMVAWIHSPMMVIKVLIVAVIAQQLEGNVVSPLVMGRTLNIHPLTIILILLVAGGLGGFLGLLLAVPTYAVVKVVVSHVYRLIQLRKVQQNRGTLFFD
ncbi:AI-2E family transporter [Thermoflavimicrobium dichotomicum]|uniref:Predicted PurR-regulated permease PerM n=1 Tax=Thermoflavimicrobium dichotomicum TaxID=46223 RepID=A0A1I3LZ45_9BACL|nr:AI-2E family transporter [Thermoflavimicrobium dichotomicum]SFI89706.1 Predicted PurR-regulated permease PerM [Thermoflavimicrobium dichotomicum]